MSIVKKSMVYNNILIRTKRTFRFFLFYSFLFWGVPFTLRLFFIDVNGIDTQSTENSLNIVTEITAHVLNNDRWSVFCLIFINNLKVCVVNIVGGVMLGIPTVINLLINGFSAADVFANIHSNGIGVSQILKHTLPHCFELVGIWLSGAIGFSLAKLMIDFMRGNEVINVKFFRFISKCIVVTVLIILLAAFIEAYVSIPYNK